MRPPRITGELAPANLGADRNASDADLLQMMLHPLRDGERQCTSCYQLKLPHLFVTDEGVTISICRDCQS